jgi:hypothetical protein
MLKVLSKQNPLILEASKWMEVTRSITRPLFFCHHAFLFDRRVDSSTLLLLPFFHTSWHAFINQSKRKRVPQQKMGLHDDFNKKWGLLLSAVCYVWMSVVSACMSNTNTSSSFCLLRCPSFRKVAHKHSHRNTHSSNTARGGSKLQLPLRNFARHNNMSTQNTTPSTQHEISHIGCWRIFAFQIPMANIAATLWQGNWKGWR